MPTANSYMDKLYGDTSQKIFKTLDLQKQREAKRSQIRAAPKAPLPDECNWRVCNLDRRPEYSQD